ncbi:unnamed protein product [Hermetia illucens]|uniref:Peptidase S1 domain-containing protein n=1 Tax=Hermetia illucens TaxID=343691 RepID=A0A7R8UYD1_HERIL|nr:trypsin beta-like [Hermetia illucens]CAD7089404.1 unnamed protein product [Hermetia illucens]
MFRVLLITTFAAGILGASIPWGVVPIPDGRIIGGEETTIEKYPYQVSIRYIGSHRCGASVLKTNVVLTAAHCVYGASKLLLRFVAGSSQRNSGGSSIYPDNIVIHSGYSPSTAQNDIALAICQEHWVFSDTIQPIQLPSASPAVGSSVIVSGWGTESEGASEIPINLRAVEVKIVDKKYCSDAYVPTGYPILEGMLCAAVSGGGKDACQGDSGGPLNSGLTQVGIVSWGWGCAQADYPGVYTDVATYASWINSNA